MIQAEAIVSDEALFEGGVAVQWQSDIDGFLHEILPNSDGTADPQQPKTITR